MGKITKENVQNTQKYVAYFSPLFDNVKKMKKWIYATDIYIKSCETTDTVYIFDYRGDQKYFVSVVKHIVSYFIDNKSHKKILYVQSSKKREPVNTIPFTQIKAYTNFTTYKYNFQKSEPSIIKNPEMSKWKQSYLNSLLTKSSQRSSFKNKATRTLPKTTHIHLP